MTPLLPIAAGLAALVVGAFVLRGLGPGLRVGRLLSATPIVPVAEASALADGPPRYVGVQGRIDAEEEFEDDAHRPLVLRRARLQLDRSGRWETVDEHLRSVDFEVRDGVDAIVVDHAVLDEGLVVVPRESTGIASDVADRVPAGTEPSTPTRLRVEQVSSVEHAIVLGVPSLRPDGRRHMTAGLGRPLVVTTLQKDEAMRVLADGDRRRPRIAAVALGLGAAFLVLGVVWAILGALTGSAQAASPSPGSGGDPRSSGEGPGLVGDPLLAIGIVVAIGVATALATLAYVRLTARGEH